MRRALIYIDTDHVEDSVSLIEAALQTHDTASCELFALVINGEYTQLIGAFDTIIQIQDDSLHQHDAKSIACVIEKLHAKHQFGSIIFPATFWGRIIAPRVAMRLHTGIVADVTAVHRTDRSVQLVRPAYGGRIMACIEITSPGPVVFTVRSGTFSHEISRDKSTRIVRPQQIIKPTQGIRLVHKEAKQEQYDIRECDILVAGGGGVLKNFSMLESLACALRGRVCASRAIVDKGIVPRSLQVGQSGKTVKPVLYFAAGIHGAIQHVVGMNDADYIISVNTNPDAPICSLSDIVVVGDAVTFIQQLLDIIKEEKRDGCN